MIWRCTKGLFLWFCKLLKIRCDFSRKIQGTYFKICALYFKIYGLYFLLHALCFFRWCETGCFCGITYAGFCLSVEFFKDYFITL